MKRIYCSVNFYFGLLIILFLSFSQTGCKSTAIVSCTNVEKFQARSGVINIPHFKLGDVILLDTVKKMGQFIMHCAIQPSNISETPPIDSIEILTNTSFSIGLEGKVSKAKVDVQADVKSNISNRTTFFLTNSIRKNVENPSSEINGKEYLLQLRSAIQNNKNVICMFVSGIIYADNFEFRVKKESGSKVKANIIKVDDFKINVSYACEGSLDIDSKNGGVFFKSTYFRLDPGQDLLVIHSIDLDLSKYNLIESLK